MRGRHDHAPECGQSRERYRSPIAELAGHDLPLDLESDDEEEHGHERVVDPVAEILLEQERPDAQLDSVAQNEV